MSLPHEAMLCPEASEISFPTFDLPGEDYVLIGRTAFQDLIRQFRHASHATNMTSMRASMAGIARILKKELDRQPPNSVVPESESEDEDEETDNKEAPFKPAFDPPRFFRTRFQTKILSVGQHLEFAEGVFKESGLPGNNWRYEPGSPALFGHVLAMAKVWSDARERAKLVAILGEIAKLAQAQLDNCPYSRQSMWAIERSATIQAAVLIIEFLDQEIPQKTGPGIDSTDHSRFKQAT